MGNELFAIDGCKMPSDASKQWSGTLKELAEKRDKIKRQIQYHMKKYHEQDGNETCDDPVRPVEKTLDSLNKTFDKIDAFLKMAEPRRGSGKKKTEVKSNITDNDSAKMKTNKGTIQGYNGVATADKKHQVIIDAQAFGSGPEQHTLSPVIEAVRDRFRRLGISEDIFSDGTLLTADTGFANEDNMALLYKQGIDAYIPDNQFRSRAPKFATQNKSHPKPGRAKPKEDQTFPASDFHFDEKNKICQCPAGQTLSLRREQRDKMGNEKMFFEGRLRQCRPCDLKSQCMRNPAAADHRKGSGRQVSFIITRAEPEPNYTDWMKERVECI